MPKSAKKLRLGAKNENYFPGFENFPRKVFFLAEKIGKV